MILPQIIVEAGFQPTSPVGAAGVFILDSSLQGILDTDTLGTGVASWADISAFVHSFTVTRASTRQQGPLLTVQASTFSAVLDNSDGRFDPDNLAGPYVAFGVTQIRPMIPVRVRAVFAGVTYPLFQGFADGWQDGQVTYSAGTAAGTGYDEVTLSATDAFKILAGITLAPIAAAGASDDAGARVTRILNSASWYTDHRTIAVGDLTLQATTYGDTVLNLLQIASDSEIGELYVDGGGNVVFRHRRAVLGEARSVLPQGVFGDLPVLDGALPYDQTILADSPQVYWPFTDPLGSGTIADLSGFSRTGTPTAVGLGAQSLPVLGAPAATSGVFSTAASSGMTSGFNPAFSACTLDMWVNMLGRTQGGTNPALMGTSITGADDKGFELFLAQTSGLWYPFIQFGNGTSQAGALSSIPLSATGWAHVAAGWDGTNIVLYVNGVLAGTGGLAGPMAAGSTGISVGYSAAGAGVPFTGAIGRAAFYGSLLSATRIAAHYAAGPPAELAYAEVGRADDDTTLANDVQATNANIGTLQEVTDTSSIATFLFARTYARTDLILQTDPAANYWAQGILQVSKGGEDRFESLIIDPQADPADLFPQVLGREYGDRLTVRRRPPGAGTITRDVLVRGITHAYDATAGNTWSTTWTLQDATRFTGFLILNSASQGLLDTDMLAY